jgi:hypothetical protein
MKNPNAVATLSLGHNVTTVFEVESSNVDAVAYKQATAELFVIFNNGGIYAYEGVPLKLFGELLAADSHGQFINTRIKPARTFRKLEVVRTIADGFAAMDHAAAVA